MRPVCSETTPNWIMEAGDKFLVSDDSVSLVIPAIAKSEEELHTCITTLGRMQVHGRDTSFSH